MTLRALIVDDEPIARRRLRRMLADVPGLQVVGEAGNAADARARITADAPAIIFVDIEMPGDDGLSLIRELTPASLPLAVIVSAHSQYALSAFDGAAVDYVLKPVKAERLRAAAARAMSLALALNRPDRTAASAGLAAETGVNRLVVTVGKKLVPVDIESIDWLRADENYVWIYAAGRRYIHRATLGGLLTELASSALVRVHRSVAVNVRAVSAVTPDPRGGAVIELSSGERVPMSRGYRDQLPRLLTGRGAAR